jgi:hypothetical protein
MKVKRVSICKVLIIFNIKYLLAEHSTSKSNRKDKVINTNAAGTMKNRLIYKK